MQFRQTDVAIMIAALAIMSVTATAAHADTGNSAAQIAQSAGQYVDDATLTTKVKTALLSDSVTSLFKISVTSNKGVVTLHGQVDKAQTAERAIALATAVQGVKMVKPDLTIVPAANN